MRRYLRITVLLSLASVLGCGAAESSGVHKPADTVIHPPFKLAEEFQLPKLKEVENTSFRLATSKNYELVRAGKWREAASPGKFMCCIETPTN